MRDFYLAIANKVTRNLEAKHSRLHCRQEIGFHGNVNVCWFKKNRNQLLGKEESDEQTKHLYIAMPNSLFETTDIYIS